MSKRRNIGDVPIVEKLYKEKQQDYEKCGGFEEDDDAYEDKRKEIAESFQKRRDLLSKNTEKPDNCLECERALGPSYLWDTYNHAVCDLCKDLKNKHVVISRTEAKKRYVLKDEDLDHRKPILRYQSKKNPHNPRYGDMKLYLLSQVEERAKMVHGTLEQVEITKDERREKREKQVNKRFENRIKAMRKEMRPDVILKSDAIHEHEYGPEESDGNGNYWMICKTCEYKNEYERL
ncbi:unnamed protein product [Bursaphelenchus okinawaensis]|uniref:XPA C-terminal domain-containing protein n=1 Tax=Bursaphelenchus okinawaensis TaxID=465554 RepID=A0A811JVD9_9BILA|nr:unnamed protein product [Bursaphelenchus okinawaensis]CAG9085635.1 unnamed protein product [Bursaphelenchus okinawaensis]